MYRCCCSVAKLRLNWPPHGLQHTRLLCPLVFPSITVQKHHFFRTQTSLWSNFHICTGLLEKPWLWLYESFFFLAKWYLCFLISTQHVEKQKHYSADKGLYCQCYGPPSGQVQLWELDCKEGKMPKNWCLPTVVLEKTPESPLDGKEIEPVSLKVNQPWILIERTDAEASASVVWSSDMKSCLTGKVTDVGKDWGLKEKRASEDEMTGCITDAMNMNLGKLREVVRDREGWGIAMSWTCLGNWTTTSFPSKEWVSAF